MSVGQTIRVRDWVLLSEVGYRSLGNGHNPFSRAESRLRFGVLHAGEVTFCSIIEDYELIMQVDNEHQMKPASSNVELMVELASLAGINEWTRYRYLTAIKTPHR